MQTAMTDTRDKRPVGRPSTFKPEYCERVQELAKDGLSWVEIAAELGVAYSTLKSWANEDNPEFLAAWERSKDLSQAWWEKNGRDRTFNAEGFSASAYAFHMKNRFRRDYGERVEVSGPNQGPIELSSSITDQTILEAARRWLFLLRSLEENGKVIDGEYKEIG